MISTTFFRINKLFTQPHTLIRYTFNQTVILNNFKPNFTYFMDNASVQGRLSQSTGATKTQDDR